MEHLGTSFPASQMMPTSRPTYALLTSSSSSSFRPLQPFKHLVAVLNSEPEPLRALQPDGLLESLSFAVLSLSTAKQTCISIGLSFCSHPRLCFPERGLCSEKEITEEGVGVIFPCSGLVSALWKSLDDGPLSFFSSRPQAFSGSIFILQGIAFLG